MMYQRVNRTILQRRPAYDRSADEDYVALGACHGDGASKFTTKGSSLAEVDTVGVPQYGRAL